MQAGHRELTSGVERQLDSFAGGPILHTRDSSRVKAIAVLASLSAAVVGVSLLVPIQGWVARAEGYVITVDKPVRRVTIPAGSDHKMVFRVSNVTSSPVTIVGVESLCGCTSVEPIPMRIPASSAAELAVSFNMEGRDGGTTYHWDPRVFTDRSGPEVRLIVDLELE